MREQWKDVDGFNGKYQVSNLGRFKRINKNGETQLLIRYDYKLPMVSMSKDGVQRLIPACKLVANAFVENPNGYKYVKYKNGYKINNRATNLEFVKKCDNKDVFCKID